MTTAPTFTWELAEPLGDAITDWTWTWSGAHPRAGAGAMFQRDLTVVIDEHTDDSVSTKQARDLARRVNCWLRVWMLAEEKGYVDTEFGMEWRHSLQRFLMLTNEERSDWFLQDWERKQHTVHLFRNEAGQFITEAEMYDAFYTDKDDA